MTAIDLEAHNGIGNEREGATMGLEVYQDVKTIHGLFRKAYCAQQKFVELFSQGV